MPPRELVDAYLHEIAKGYNIAWAPPGYVDPSNNDDDEGGGGGGLKVCQIPFKTVRLLTERQQEKALEPPLLLVNSPTSSVCRPPRAPISAVVPFSMPTPSSLPPTVLRAAVLPASASAPALL